MQIRTVMFMIYSHVTLVDPKSFTIFVCHVLWIGLDCVYTLYVLTNLLRIDFTILHDLSQEL